MKQLFLLAAVICFGVAILKFYSARMVQPSAPKPDKLPWRTLTAEEAKAQLTVLAPYDTDVYCYLCNRTEHIKAGQPIPVCCGRLMEILD